MRHPGWSTVAGCLLAVAMPQLALASLVEGASALPRLQSIATASHAGADAASQPSWGWWVMGAAGGGAAWGLRRWAKRGLRPTKEPSALRRAGSLALTPQASVHTVRWGQDEFLIACTSQQLLMLAKRSVQDETS